MQKQEIREAIVKAAKKHCTLPPDDESSRELLAARIAEKLCRTFFDELTTAMTNSVRNFEMASKVATDPVSMHYYKGKYDAFNEVAERLRKEYDPAMQPLSSTESTRRLCEDIRRKKNEDVDNAFPENKYRCTENYQEILRIKKRVADGLEIYAKEGFELGRRFERRMNNTALVELLQDLLSEIGAPEEFNARAFADAFDKAFIPKNHRDRMENTDEAVGTE